MNARHALVMMSLALALATAACEPKKPTDPRPPMPKTDFTHERSAS